MIARSEINRPQGTSHGAAQTDRELEQELADRFREIACLTLVLKEREMRDRRISGEIDWLSRIAVALLATPRWWSVLPPSLRRRSRNRWLRRAGLFDAEDYLRCNPDVRATGADPLRHYLQHGMTEGRSRSEP